MAGYSFLMRAWTCSRASAMVAGTGGRFLRDRADGIEDLGCWVRVDFAGLDR